jgi:hypothetical protein
MNMTGEQRIAAPRQRVWEALNDPEILRASVPGCQSLEMEGENRFTATVAVKIGPIGARFKGAVSIVDLDPPYGYTLILEGNGGIAGSVNARAKVRLGEDAGSTPITYEAEARVGGRMAQLGGPIIDASAKRLAGQFFSSFGDIVGGVPQPAEAASEAAAAPPIAPPTIAPPTIVAPSPTGGLPMAWILATVVAALAGFLVGRGQGMAGSDWAGLAIGLLVILVAGAGFEYGRRSAEPVLMLDSALLRRLIDGAKE